MRPKFVMGFLGCRFGEVAAIVSGVCLKSDYLPPRRKFSTPPGILKVTYFSMVLRKGPINHYSLPITSIEKYFIVDLLLLFLRFGMFYLMTQSNFLRRLNSLFYSNSHDFLQFAN